MTGKTTLGALALGLLLALPAAAEDAPFTLSASTVKGGDTVTLTFRAPLEESEGRHWVCIVKQGEADSSYGVWAYAETGATSAELTAPEVDGTYEVRLHGHYPTKSCDVLHREPLVVTGLTPTKPEDIGVNAPKQAPVDQPIKVTFKAPLVPTGDEKFWVCIVPAGAPDTAQGLWTMVPIGAAEIDVPAASSSGDHEIRLHGNYPTQTTHVVARAPIQITGAEDTLPTDDAAVQATLEAASIELGQAPAVTFNVPLRPITGEKYWIGIANAELPAEASGLWKMLSPGDTRVTLDQPISTGKHRITLHANYPTRSTHPIATLELDVTGDAAGAPTDLAGLELVLAAPSIKVGEQATVTFSSPLRARTGEKFWITLIPAGQDDTEWGQYTYVDVGAGSVELPAPTEPGDYEVRLHAQYPTKSSNVVARAKLEVE